MTGADQSRAQHYVSKLALRLRADKRLAHSSRAILYSFTLFDIYTYTYTEM
jgi:hypothetical protein